MSTERTEKKKASADSLGGRLSTQYAQMYKEAFGKTSQAKPQDLDFFFPDMGPLTTDSYRKRLETSQGTQEVKLPRSGVQIRYAWVSQRGYYPDSLDKANQDALMVKLNVGGSTESAFFGVFDGHGTSGTECAAFARERVFNNLVGDLEFLDNPSSALHNATAKTNQQLHKSLTDDTLSGTTAVTMLIRGREISISNVGDSRIVAAELHGTDLVAVDLTHDQTPFRKDELLRVKAAGARVLTLEQLDGLRDQSIQEWGKEEEDDGDPPRIWAPDGNYPGTAFTRSLGDSVAEEVGVIGEPEVETLALREDHAFFVIASDGVWEFLTSQAVVDLVDKHSEPSAAAMSVCVESYKAWLTTEARTDDITIIVIEVKLGKGLSTPSSPGPSLSKSPSRASGLGSGRNSFSADGSGGAAINRSLVQSKSIRKGLARGSLDFTEMLQPGDSPSLETVNPAFLETCEKTNEEVRYLMKQLTDHTLFHLPPAKLKTVLGFFRQREVAEGEILIPKGGIGRFFYVIQSGTFALKIPAKEAGDPGDESSTEQTLRRYAPHAGLDSTFGSHALVSGAKPYGGYIVARSPGVVWCLEKRAYKAAIQGDMPSIDHSVHGAP